MPLEVEKVAEGEPLIRMQKNVDETRANTQFTQEVEKPKAPSMALRIFQLILSKALDISNLISIPERREVLRECIASWAVIIPSRICLPSRV